MKMFLIAGAAALVLMAAPAYAQSTAHDHAAPPGGQASAGTDHSAMTSMMADMQAKQKTLDDLVAKMNAAKGQEKVDLMAAVLTEMASMHQGMMCPMMQMPAGPPEGGPHR
jgi:archaellin